MQEAPEQKKQKEKSGPSFFQELIKMAAIVVLIVVPIRLYIAQPFIVSGASMAPTFHTGDYLIVDQISYRFNNPDRGDIVIFKYPNNPSKFFIKRVIGLPGEKIKIEKESIYIINEEHPDGFKYQLPTEAIDPPPTHTSTEEKLGEKQYFVIGDNREHSLDSRKWGPLEEKYIVGKAFLRLFPFQQIDVLPGSFQTNS